MRPRQKTRDQDTNRDQTRPQRERGESERGETGFEAGAGWSARAKPSCRRALMKDVLSFLRVKLAGSVRGSAGHSNTQPAAIANGTCDSSDWRAAISPLQWQQAFLIPAPFEPTSDAGWRDRLRVWNARGGRLPKWGPDPSQPGCECPSDLLAEHMEGHVTAELPPEPKSDSLAGERNLPHGEGPATAFESVQPPLDFWAG
jgi:hypothetical protein